jgi:hypothetical protein
MSLQAGGSYDHKISPSASRANMKWLNVVLDLNGIFCVCQAKGSCRRIRRMWMTQGPTPTLVGSEGVLFTHPMKGSLENLAVWQISLFGAL